MVTAIAGVIKALLQVWSDNTKQKALDKSFERNAEHRLKQAKLESQIKRVESGDEAAASLDLLSFQHRGIKDDYLLIITTLPLLLLFAGPLLELAFLQSVYKAGDLTAAIMAGFMALDQAPEWYLVALALVYVDTFGFRRLLREAMAGKLGQWISRDKKR